MTTRIDLPSRLTHDPAIVGAKGLGTTGTILTNDGVRLHYREQGSGSTVLLISGWQQSADLWRHQIDALATNHQVIAYDHRGHGKSDNPSNGYKVHRLAADLNDLIQGLGLRDISIIAHSMGCHVTLAYLELFGPQLIRNLVLVDQPLFITSDPSWSEETNRNSGAVFDQDSVLATVNALADPAHHDEVVRGLVNMLTSPDINAADKQWIIQQNLLMDGAHSAALFYNQAHQDWRTQLAHIKLPTLIIGAELGITSSTGLAWARHQLPDGHLEMISADDGGSHFMFIENPNRFNKLVKDFLA
jgi:non-heme chloroperoxidase